jgi:hypothetical protein
MLWGAAALTLFGVGALDNGVPLPVVDGRTLAPIDAMPAMLASILGPGIKGIVVAGMLAATMSVNSSYLLGWSAVISQDIILPMREQMGKPALSSRSQIFVNRLANLFVGLFLMFWACTTRPRRRLSLPEHHRHDLSGGHVYLRDRRPVLEAREHDWRLSGDADGCRRSDHPVFLPALERERHRLLRIWPGRPRTRPRFPVGKRAPHPGCALND